MARPVMAWRRVAVLGRDRRGEDGHGWARKNKTMLVTDISDQTDYPSRLRSEADELGLTRSGGLHLTSVIRSIEETIKPREVWCTNDELAFFAAGGFMWERVYSEAMRDSLSSDESLVRPGEVTLDGITGSPDLLRISPEDVVLIETKCTWRGLRQWESLEKNFWSWLCQVKSYCLMIGTGTAELHVFFVAGDWRPPIPCVRAVRLEFTDRELSENWSMLVGHARRKGWL